MFTYQKTNRYFGRIDTGLEELGCAELIGLGAIEPRPAYRGVFFTADAATLYRVVYGARLFTRILAPLLEFDCHSAKYLYKTARQLDWPAFLDLSHTFAVHANVSASRITHSQYAALCLKDAIVDQFRDRLGRRPDVDTEKPDVQFDLHVHDNRATIYLDAGGGSLHQRGYRQDPVTAPMRETVAAAIIRLIDWDGQQPLIDPMCGSGTLLAEALMDYCRIPAGFLRSGFGCSFLPEFDQALWGQVKNEMDGRMRKPAAGLLRGSDRDKAAVAAAGRNLRTLPYGEDVQLARRDLQQIERIENSIIVSNPPYGLRQGEPEQMATFMKDLGDFLKRRCTGSVAYLYFGNRELIKHIGLRPAWKKPLRNGGLDGRLVKFELY